MEEKSFKEVNKELNLIMTGDWSIENDDANRVVEFIKYYNNNIDELDEGVEFEFLELVISSMNEAILENKVDNEMTFLFKEFIYPHLSNELALHFQTIIYWDAIADQEEFPVGFLIREMLGDD
ncbi:hypothetical protein ATE84_1008 [Aquimarina sp. MAR_2010_214]|uniref:hypothetical protein n=1 Tax=Aquimarina sp. MAR_2010_214 TaxID=1250026 RepID=UPI000C709398|nr:hypothetical protein [Aquimarina sp. MAR_2010_214]PKV48992.1 hypothetical protein ATE84_1008 [Aquimarina sp. MAR_2010_214]